jgi:hypothetical protein
VDRNIGPDLKLPPHPDPFGMKPAPQGCRWISLLSHFPRSILHPLHALGKIIQHLILTHHRYLDQLYG